MALPDISDITSTDLIELDKDFKDKEACIDFLIELLDRNGRIQDREQVKDDIMAREKETTTGVGKGIGIPHAKTDGVDSPVVAFVRSEDGVDFGAMDDTLAHLIFMLLVPADSSKDHLKLLSSISRSLVHEDVREELLNAEDSQTIFDVLERAID